MKRFWSMYRVEQKIFFRSPDVILFCLAMPLVVFIVITVITGGKNAADSRPSQTLCKPPMWCRIGAPHWRFL